MVDEKIKTAYGLINLCEGRVHNEIVSGIREALLAAEREIARLRLDLDQAIKATQWDSWNE